MPATAVDSATLLAYRQTAYRVQAPGRHAVVPAAPPPTLPFVLTIDRPSGELASLYRRFGLDCAGYVTACNPFSQPVGRWRNALRQRRLENELIRRGLVYFHGCGEHISGPWPAEPSFLVLGLSREEAAELGRRYRQNAVLFCGPDTVPQLILLR